MTPATTKPFETIDTSSISLVDDGAALLSMRNSDFDVYSAYGEVIDNAIQASANNIQIKLAYRQATGNAKLEPIESITFGDDGSGMETGVLHRCLRLGYSSRYNDRTGIGRFGVGLTLAAINQCKKVEVFSKTSGGDWQYTYIDLDMVTATPSTMKEIPIPIKKAPSKEQAALAGNSSGTIVVWSKYDAQPASASEVVDETRIWIGRTYRKYIWRGVAITLNQSEIFAIDPLYVTTEKTQFPTDPKAFEYTSITMPWRIASSDTDVPLDSERYNITIRLSLLPAEMRQTQGSGNSNESRARHIHRNEGMSILRKDREVFYDRIPHWPGDKLEEIDRWWGCEISFDPILDKEFTVKNIKRGAVPVKELKKALRDQIEPTRRTALAQIRDVFAKTKAAAGAAENRGNPSGHEDAERAARNTTQPRSQIDRDKDLKDEAIKLSNTVSETADERQKAEWAARFTAFPFTIMDGDWVGPDFIQTNHLGGNDVLKYNARHLFFQELDNIRKAVMSDGADESTAQRLRSLIDLLLLSFSKAEAMVDPKVQQTPESLLEYLRMNWGQYLRNYIDTYRKEHGAE